MWIFLSALVLLAGCQLAKSDQFECPNNEALVGFTQTKDAQGSPVFSDQKCLKIEDSVSDCYMAAVCTEHPMAPANKYTYVAGYRVVGGKLESKCCPAASTRMSDCSEVDGSSPPSASVMRSLKPGKVEVCKFKSVENFKPPCKEQPRDSYHSNEAELSSVDEGLTIVGQGIIVGPMEKAKKPCPLPPTPPPPDLSQCAAKKKKTGGKSSKKSGEDHSDKGRHRGTEEGKGKKSGEKEPLKERKTRGAERKEPKSGEKGDDHHSHYRCPPKGHHEGNHFGEDHKGGRVGRQTREFYRLTRGAKSGEKHHGGKERCPEEKCHKKPKRCPDQKISTTCSAVGDLPNGVVTYSSNATCGQFSRCTVANYTCNSCYQLIGSNNSTCLCGGYWYPTQPICKKMCPAIVAPSHGSASSGTDGCSNVATVITFSCDNKYLLSPAISISCNEGGIWSAPVPKCLAPCPPIAPPLNGAEVYSGGSVGVQSDNLYVTNTVATYTCSQTCYKPTAPSSICYDGLWTPPSVSCVFTGCVGAKSGPSGGSVSGGQDTCNPLGTVASYSCSDPCFSPTIPSSTCSGGVWNPLAVTCARTKCSGPVAGPAGGSVSGGQASCNPFGTVATYSCFDACSSPTIPSSTCSSSGTWTPLGVACAKTGCVGPVAAPSGGSVSGGQASCNPVGTVATFSCGCGSSPSSPSTTCLADGTWSPAAVSCSSSPPNCPSGWVRSGASCYKNGGGTMSFAAGEAFCLGSNPNDCKKRTPHLPYFTSDAMWNDFQTATGALGLGGTVQFFTGLNRQNQPNWQYTSGAPDWRGSMAAFPYFDDKCSQDPVCAAVNCVRIDRNLGWNLRDDGCNPPNFWVTCQIPYQ